jgi:TetR/AcrR family transcriptional regulator, regulator of cefoperazone and chloramphenicol sensitivity
MMDHDARDWDHATRRRLLEVSAEIFAGKGFRKATVRDICGTAGTNIAAIHYHFGNKQALYNAVIQYAYQVEKAKFPSNQGIPPDAPADRRIHAFIRSLLLRVFQDGEVTTFAKLMQREMVEPTPALRMLVESELFPLRLYLEGIVRSLTSDALDEDALRDVVLSITGQFIVFHHLKPAIELLYPGFVMTESRIDAIAEHITQFSLAGLRSTVEHHAKQRP